VRVMRAEPGRFADVAAKSVGAVWRAYDLQLSVYAALLAAFGLVMAYTNSVESGESLLTGTVFQRALMWSAIAMVVYVVMTAFDYRWLKTVAWPVYFVNLGLLVLTLAIGDGVGGSARWVGVGPVQFQFSELAKILMIIVLATYLGNREGRLDSFASIVGACLLMGPAVALVMLQPDLGSSLVLISILAGMLFLSGASLARLLVIGFGMLAVIPVAWLYLLRDYQKDRILSFLNPSTDVLGSGWQVAQAQMTVGSGGVVGTGLTNGGLVRGGYLPVQESDFVFPVLAQELGFIGAVVVFLLFIALLWRILACAWRSRDPFGTMFGAGLASAILIQVFVNVGMGIGILPVTGIPLPFISHGGASLISLAIGLGVIQSINIRQHRAEW
jgi:rod shape determining protein RodA